MDRGLFIEKMHNASATIDSEYCEDVITDSLRKIPENLNQDGTMNLIIVMEELAELSQEVSKALRGKENREGLIEEIADVYLGNKYLQKIFDISDEEIAKACNVKLSRQEERNGFVNKEDDITYDSRE